jgi:TolA-binding protein
MFQKSPFISAGLILLTLAGFDLAPLAARAQPMVQSQEGIALENQILQLQNQVQQMQAGGGVGGGSSLGGNSAPPPPSNNGAPDPSVLTNLLNQVNQLQAQVQELSGRVDTLQNQVNTQNAAMEKEIGDLKFQMGGGNPAAAGGPGAAPGAAPSQPGTPPELAPPPAAATPPGSAADSKTALRNAEAAMAKHDYQAAEQNARAVLAGGKSSPEAYHAQYILAQALFSENKPQDAAIAYDDTYNRARTGAYAPGSLLGLANSLIAVHQAAAACDTLASLNSQFPSPPKGMGPEIQAAGRRAHCSS